MWMWIHRVALISLTIDRVHTVTPEPDVRTVLNASTEPQLPTSTDTTGSGDATTDNNTTDKGKNNVNYPYMAAILHSNGLLLGSGAIVADRWVVATAFQMGAFKAEALRVRVGSNSPLAGGQLIPVLQLFPHPMFRRFINDFALLKTADSMQLGSAVQPIPVAPDSPQMGEAGALLTWDNTSVVQSQADILPAADCQVFYPDMELSESNICAVMDHILPYKLGLFGSPLVWNDSLVGLYMGLEAGSFKPALCNSLAPVVNWVRRMVVNETETMRLFPLD